MTDDGQQKKELHLSRSLEVRSTTTVQGLLYRYIVPVQVQQGKRYASQVM
jgi:hypothetical protein